MNVKLKILFFFICYLFLRSIAISQISFNDGQSHIIANPFGLGGLSGGLGSMSNIDLKDLDNDGDLDLLSGDFHGNFHFFENTAGIGNIPYFNYSEINPFGLYDIGVESNVNLVDLDNDGDLDLMSGDFDGNFIYFENQAGSNNTPQFDSLQLNPFGLENVGFSTNSNLIDFDSDGDLDLMSGDYDGNFLYFENISDSNSLVIFDEVELNPFNLNFVSPFHQDIFLDWIFPFFGDFDNDNDIDIICGHDHGNYYYFENIANPGNQPYYASMLTNPFGLTDSVMFNKPHIIDIDDDGDLDLISGTLSGDFIFYENISGLNDTFIFDSIRINVFNLESVGSYSNSNLVDMDNDGDLDMISGSKTGNFFYFENREIQINNLFLDKPIIDPFGLKSLNSYSKPSIFDIDNDGDLDMISGSGEGDFFYFENISISIDSPIFTEPVKNPFNLTKIDSLSSPELKDLDNDGDLDLVSGSANGNFYYFENISNISQIPEFSTVTINPFGLDSIGLYSNPNIVDLDGDSDLDLMSVDAEGNYIYFENISNINNVPSFTEPLNNPYGLFNFTFDKVTNSNLVDIDGDGDLDMMSGSKDGDFYYNKNTTCENNPLEFSLITKDISCYGQVDGFIELNTFGLSPLTLSLDSGVTSQTDSTFSNLAANTYNILIQDANQCYTSIYTTISEPDPISLSSLTATPESDANASDGSITIIPDGGTGTLNSTWTPGNFSGTTISGLSAGDYIVTITDANNCSYTQTVTLGIKTSINTLEIESLSIYPNPTNSNLTITFEQKELTDIQFNLYNLVGKRLLEEKQIKVQGSVEHSMNLSDINKGIYLLEISTEKGTLTRKISIYK